VCVCVCVCVCVWSYSSLVQKSDQKYPHLSVCSVKTDDWQVKTVLHVVTYNVSKSIKRQHT